MKALLLGLGLTLIALLALSEPDTPVCAETPKASGTEKGDKDLPQDKLPLNAVYWRTKALVDLGKLVSTRNEAKTNNRVVWIIRMEKVTTPKLQIVYRDEESIWGVEPVTFEVIKNDDPNAKTTDVRAIVKLPPKKFHNDIRFVEIEPVPDPKKKKN